MRSEKVVVGPEAPRDYDDEGRESLRSKLLSSVSSFASTTTPASAELSAMSSSTLMAPGAMSTSGSGSGGEAPTDATIVCDDEGRGPTTQVRDHEGEPALFFSRVEARV